MRDVDKIKNLYYKSSQFRLDVISILPLDYACHFFYRNAAKFRLNRLVRRERLLRFMEATETRSSFPNAFRIGAVVWFIVVIIHWNGCFYFLISETIGLGTGLYDSGEKSSKIAKLNFRRLGLWCEKLAKHAAVS